MPKSERPPLMKMTGAEFPRLADIYGTPKCPCWDTNGCQTPEACAVTEADYQEVRP